VERRFEADTSEEDGDEDLRVRGGLSVVGRGRRRPDRRGERRERGREEEEDSFRSPEIASVASGRHLLSPPPVEMETRISFPTSRVVEPYPREGRGNDAERLPHGHPNGPVGLPGPVRPVDCLARETEGNPSGKAGTKQALRGG
jgi:hypothetical protein